MIGEMRKLRRAAKFGGIMVVTAIAIGSPLAASADGWDSMNSRIVSVINAADPDFLKQWVPTQSMRRSVSQATALPASASVPVLTGAAQVGFAIGGSTDFSAAVELQDNAVAYFSDTRVQITVDRGLGFIGMATIIEAGEDSERFPYSASPDSGVSLEIGENGGMLLIRNDEVVGGVLKPWAKDAVGNDVPTHYEVSGTGFVQVVEHVGRNFMYPIVADPTYYGESLIDYITATPSPKETHVYTSGWWTTNILVENDIVRFQMTDEYARRVASTYNTLGARQQVSCHAWWAALKRPWNIELWRPTVGEAATVAAACNP